MRRLLRNFGRGFAKSFSALAGLAPDMRDVFVLAGTGLIGAGCWMVYPPAGLIAPGAILVAVAVLGVRAGRSD